MSALIIGGADFIGTNMADKLCARGDGITNYSNIG